MIIQQDFPLAKILWYRIGPVTQYLLRVENAQDIENALKFIEKNKIQKVAVIGLGSNLIFTDNYFNGAVICILQSKHIKHNISINNEIITVFAGTIFDDLIQYSLSNKLTGLEWAGGLPGTVGGAIRGNAGAFGKEIRNSVISVDVVDINNKDVTVRTLNKDELDFSYRNSLIKKNKNLIIISAALQLHPASEQELKAAENIYASNINYRKEKHPVEYPTCGSVFKNISDPDQINKILSIWPDIKELTTTKWHGKISMGYIISRLGFTGFKRGDVQVSPKHSNFIVNLGTGTARDVIEIIEEIQQKVRETFGFTPEIEAEIVSS